MTIQIYMIYFNEIISEMKDNSLLKILAFWSYAQQICRVWTFILFNIFYYTLSSLKRHCKINTNEQCELSILHITMELFVLIC